MKLYGAALSPYVARVLLAIRRKGLDVAPMPAPGDGLKSPEYLAINPYGKMPALVDGDVRVIESEVICEYLEDTRPVPAMLPPDAAGRARSRIVSRAVDLYVLPPLQGLVGQMNPATRDGGVAEKHMAELTRGLSGLDTFLAGPWALGPAMTLADCALVPACFYLERFLPAFGRLDPFEPYPKLAQVWATAKADPVVAKVLAEMGQALEDFMRARAANTSRP